MLLNLLAYSGITAKVKAMDGHLLSEDDYKNIANLDSIPDFVSYLRKQHSYQHIFENVDEHIVHRGQIEAMITDSLYDDYSSLYRFASSKQRSILKLTFFRFEVNILKICLQRVYNKRNTINLSSFEEFFHKHSKLNIQSLIVCNNIEDFINNLKGTDYYNCFKLIQNQTDPSIFDYEMQLDIFYFERLWKLKNKYLKGVQLKTFEDIYGILIDLLNISWIYRSKNYYHIDSNKIYSYIVPINHKLTRNNISKLVETATMDEFINILRTTYYGKHYEELTQDAIEPILKEIMNKLYYDGRRKFPFSIAPVTCYLFLKEQEIDHLTTALECIRYGLGPNETLNYLR